jgi:predicted ATPase
MRSPGLVGRAAELERLCRQIEEARAGEGGVVLVTGEAGIGKIRLLEEMARVAAEAGMAVLTGRAVEGGGTYRPIAEALLAHLRDERLEESDDLRPYRAALRRIVPGWAASGADEELAPSVDPVVILGEGLLRLLRAIGGDRGCLLRLEDLHWTDAGSIALVAYLAGAGRTSRVLILGSARDEPAYRAATRLADTPDVSVLRLTRMTTDEVVELAEACRDGPPMTGAEMRVLIDRADGLPFLVEELANRDRTLPLNARRAGRPQARDAHPGAAEPVARCRGARRRAGLESARHADRPAGR